MPDRCSKCGRELNFSGPDCPDCGHRVREEMLIGEVVMLRARVEELEKQNAAKDALLAQFAAKEILRSTFAQDNSPLDLTATDEECGLDGEE